MPSTEDDGSKLKAAEDRALRVAKRSRNGYKLNVTNALTKLQQQIVDRVSDDELKISIMKLDSYRQNIDDLDSQILPLLPDDEFDDALQDTMDLKDRILQNVGAAKNLIDSRLAQKVSQPSASTTNSATASPRPAPLTVKLPKLDIRKYDGDPLAWREFWDSFRSTIHDNTQLSKVEKLKYLKQYLMGEAFSVADGYPLSDATYDAVVDALKDRFGDDELAIFAHLDAMHSLSKSSNDMDDIQRVLDKVNVHIRCLDHLGVPEDSSGRFYVPLILSKLPAYIRVEVYRRNGSKKFTLDGLRKHLREELDARQMGKLALGEKNASTKGKQRHRSGKLATSEYSSRRHRSRSSSVSEDYDGSDDVETAMLTSAKRTKGKTTSSDMNVRQFPCFYCRGSHFPDECDQYTDLGSRLQMVKDSCMLCLSKKHKTEQCWHQQRPCYHCNSAGEHHRSLCPRKFGGKPKTETCYLATERKATDRKFLPTACATAKGEKCSAKVHLLLDQCAERSFGKIDTLNKLGAKLIRYETAAIAGIQSEPDRVRTMRYPIYELKVLTQKRSTITITVSGVKSVSAPLNRPCLTDQDILFPSDLRVNNSVYAESCLIDLDLLIGLDHYYDFVSYGQVILGSGLFLQNTELGYVLTGCLKDRNSSDAPRTEAVFLATEVSTTPTTLLSPGRASASAEESPTSKPDFTACVNKTKRRRRSRKPKVTQVNTAGPTPFWSVLSAWYLFLTTAVSFWFVKLKDLKPMLLSVLSERSERLLYFGNSATFVKFLDLPVLQLLFSRLACRRALSILRSSCLVFLTIFEILTKSAIKLLNLILKRSWRLCLACSATFQGPTTTPTTATENCASGNLAKSDRLLRELALEIPGNIGPPTGRTAATAPGNEVPAIRRSFRLPDVA